LYKLEQDEIEGIMFLKLLENDYKTELVGNLLASHGEGLGFLESFGADLLNIPYAAKVSLFKNGKRLRLRKIKHLWQPNLLYTEFKVKDLKIIEEKAAHGNTILSHIKIHSNSSRKSSLTLVIESAIYSPSTPFRAQITKDGMLLNLRNEFKFRLRSSQKFSEQFMHDHLEFKKREWISKKSRELLGDDLPVKFSYVPKIGETKKKHNYLSSNKAYVRQSLRISLSSHSYKEITIAMEFSQKLSLGKDTYNPQQFFLRTKEYWEEFAGTLPFFDCSDPMLRKLFYYSFYVLKSNQVKIDLPHLKNPFTSATKFFYWGQFFWDSAFQALGWQWCNETWYAENELKGLVEHQWNSGMIPSEFFLSADPYFSWRSGKTSWITHPPIHPIAFFEVYKKFADKRFLKFMYEHFLKYDDWLWYNLDGDKDGLSSYRHIWETGWDDNQRWTNVSKNNMLDPWIESVDFNALIYLQRKILLEVSRLIGDRKAEEVLKARLKVMKKSFSKFWHKKEGFFYDITEREHKYILVKTAAGFYPLLTDVVSPGEKKMLLNHLLNPKEFWTPCPVPCTSRDNPTYDSGFTWRGANWPIVTWLILLGLIKSNEKKIAKNLLQKFLASITKERKLVAEEYYDSQTGRPTFGASHYGWSGVIIDMLCRFVAGINSEVGNRVTLNPLDIGLEWLKLENIKYKEHNLSINWVKGKDYSLKVNGKEKVKQANLEKVRIDFNG